jgi:CDP-glycerol glycerophosphotransferase
LWITNVNIERGLSFKKKGTYYVNTWHGTGPKGFDKARKDYNFSNVNLFSVDGQYSHDAFKKYYKVPEKSFIWSGRPREDYLFNKTDVDFKQAKKEFGFSEGKLIVLYMPTFRESKYYSDDGRLNITFKTSVLSKLIKNDFVILYHGHHFTSKIDGFAFGENIIDETKADVNRLYLASDILVTDYSSCIFDFLILQKPVICYAPDYDEYSKKRGLLFDMDKEIPGGVTRSEEELGKRIVSICENPEKVEFSKFFSKFIQRKPNATDAIITRMVNEGALPKQK